MGPNSLGHQSEITIVISLSLRYPERSSGSSSSTSSSSSSSPFISCPEAVVTHPWWGGGQRQFYHHFYKWAQGDGQLLHLYPQYTYYSFPNVAECLVITTIISLALVASSLITSSSSSNSSSGIVYLALLRGVVLCLGVIMSEMMGDITKHCFLDRTRILALYGWPRYVAAAESSLVILALEIGRLNGHWRRGMLGQSFMLR